MPTSNPIYIYIKTMNDVILEFVFRATQNGACYTSAWLLALSEFGWSACIRAGYNPNYSTYRMNLSFLPVRVVSQEGNIYIEEALTYDEELEIVEWLRELSLRPLFVQHACRPHPLPGEDRWMTIYPV